MAENCHLKKIYDLAHKEVNVQAIYTSVHLLLGQHEFTGFHMNHMNMYNPLSFTIYLEIVLSI